MENLDENEATSIQEVYFDFMGLGEEILIEVRSTSDDSEFKRRHISCLIQPLKELMFTLFDERDWFVLHGDIIDTVSSEAFYGCDFC